MITRILYLKLKNTNLKPMFHHLIDYRRIVTIFALYRSYTRFSKLYTHVRPFRKLFCDPYCFVDNKRGWFGLYNSRLIGGGIRLLQKRIDSYGANDKRNYDPKWKEYTEINDTASWMHSKSHSTNFLFFSKYTKVQIIIFFSGTDAGYFAVYESASQNPIFNNFKPCLDDIKQLH